MAINFFVGPYNYVDNAEHQLTGRANASHQNANLHEINFVVTTTGASTATLTIKATSGAIVYVNWGDGTITKYTGTGANQNLTRAYTGAGTFACLLYGEIQKITTWQSTDTKIMFATAEIAKCRYLTQIYCGANGSMPGNIKHFNQAANISLFIAPSNATLICDLSWFSAKTAINTLGLANCAAVTGDIAALNALTAITSLNLSGCPLLTYTSGRPARNGCTENLVSCGLSTTEVDNYIIDANTAVKTGGTIAIGGTNAPRTAASSAAVSALSVRGVTVTANGP